MEAEMKRLLIVIVFLMIFPPTKLMGEEPKQDWVFTEGPQDRHGSAYEIRNIISNPGKTESAFAFTESGIFKTDDFGKTWSKFGPPDVVSRDVLFHPMKPEEIYVLAGNTVWKTTNDGTNWEKIYEKKEEPVLTMMFDDKDAKVLYLLHKKSLMTTKDEGKTWIEEKYDIEAGKWVYPSRSPKPLATDIAPDRLRIYIPGSAPKDISPKITGMFHAAVTSHKDPSVIAILGENKIFFTQDMGKNWKTYRTPDIDPVTWAKFHPLDDKKIIIASSDNGVYEYGFEDEKLKKIGKTKEFWGAKCIDPSSDGTTLWAGTYNGVWVYHSDKPFVPAEILNKIIKINSPRGGHVSAVAIHPKNPNIVFVGGEGMAYTLDGGKNWQHYNDIGSHVHYISSIGFSLSEPDVMYSLICSDLFKSTNAGLNSTRMKEKSFVDGEIKVDPFDAETVLIVARESYFTSDDKLFITNNSGRTITTDDNFKTYNARTAFFDLNKEGVAFCIFDKEGIFTVKMTKDHGRNWTVINTPEQWKNTGFERVALDPKDNGLLYAEIKSRNVITYWFRYLDSETWEIYYSPESGIIMTSEIENKIKQLFPKKMQKPDPSWSTDDDEFCVAPSNPDIAYCAKPYLQKTTDGGKTWQDSRAGTTYADINNCFTRPDKEDSIYLLTSFGLLVSDDFGENWEKVKYKGIDNPKRIFLNLEQKRKLYVSDDNNLWTVDENTGEIAELQNLPNDPVRSMGFDPTDLDVFYCLRYATISKTTDGGATWQTIPLRKPTNSDFDVSKYGKSLIVICSDKDKLDIYESLAEPREADLSRFKGSIPNFRIGCITIFQMDSSRLACHSGNSVFVSNDRGNSWEERKIPKEFILGRMKYHPKEKDVLLLMSWNGDLAKYSISDDKLTKIADGLEKDEILNEFTISSTGNTFWLGRNNGQMWYYREK
jgi:photosystem II stability/assembly factor-like uncharacterized protein